MHKLNISVEMTHKTEFTIADFVILKVGKKEKRKKKLSFF